MPCIQKLLWTTDLTLITAFLCIFFSDAYQNTIVRDLALPLAKSSRKQCTEGAPNPSGAPEHRLPTALFQLPPLLPLWLRVVGCSLLGSLQQQDLFLASI